MRPPVVEGTSPLSEPVPVDGAAPARERCRGRGYRAERCDACGLRSELCLCAELAPIETRTSVVFVMNWRERSKPSNTARLAVRLLPKANIIERGRSGSNVPDPARQLLQALDPGRCLLLYPSERASALDLNPALRLSELQLIVPDGTWGQTRRWVRREAWLEGVPHVRLPEPLARGDYRLRRAAEPGLLSTFEATAHALGVLEGPACREALLAAFARWQGRALRSRDGALRPCSNLDELDAAALHER